MSRGPVTTVNGDRMPRSCFLGWRG